MPERMPERLHIAPFAAQDICEIVPNAAQQRWLADVGEALTLDYGIELLRAGPAWTVRAADTGRIVLVGGFRVLFAQGHVEAWSFVADPVGPLHVALTRAVRAHLAGASYRRIEALIDARVPAAARWADLLGFALAARLRKWGPAGTDHLLYDRVAP
jgi:hypothetical protein